MLAPVRRARIEREEDWRSRTQLMAVCATEMECFSKVPTVCVNT